MKQIQRVSFPLLVFLGLIHLVNAQAGLYTLLQHYWHFTAEDLGSTANFSDQGLNNIPVALVTSQQPVPVLIRNHRVLCDVSGMNRGTSSLISVLVEFQYNFPSGSGTLATCDGTTVLTRQYQFSCDNQNQWITEVFCVMKPFQ